MVENIRDDLSLLLETFAKRSLRSLFTGTHSIGSRLATGTAESPYLPASQTLFVARYEEYKPYVDIIKNQIS